MKSDPIQIDVSNCFSRIILDETSASVPEVMELVSKAFKDGDCLAYIWRRNADVLQESNQKIIDNVFAPMKEAALRVSRHDLSNIPCIELRDVFDLSVNKGIPLAENITSRYQLESFANINSKERMWSQNLYASAGAVRDGQVSFYDKYVGNLSLRRYELGMGEDPEIHIDGETNTIVPYDDKRDIFLRAVVVHQGEGTRFYQQSVADLKIDLPFLGERILNPYYLQDWQKYKTKTGDVLFLENGQRTLSRAFIHQAAKVENPKPEEQSDLPDLRLVSVYNMKLS